ncbi:hypothetical protein Pint_06802 [Pistacia integerrima]|uniref:Uncharacterized protein n=1 Tax=Pistacia integerrima TaxID=434235 RepID=A0ACC0XTL4_9ROSI|nr:hypothetical protein Pint_06802 [Pistacia integerrima]
MIRVTFLDFSGLPPILDSKVFSIGRQWLIPGAHLFLKLLAPQVPVPSHKSLGGFVCHCGWNSVLEAIRGGLPMLVWPLYAKNKLNKVSVVEELKVALAVEVEDDGLVGAEELEKLLTKLMNSMSYFDDETTLN